MDAVTNSTAGLGGGRAHPRVTNCTHPNFFRFISVNHVFASSRRVRYIYIFLKKKFAFCFFAPACTMHSQFTLYFLYVKKNDTVTASLIHVSAVYFTFFE